MARSIERLKATSLKISKPGMYPDGRGLYLQVTSATAKSWVYRYTVNGRERFMGLGSAFDFSLAEARAKAEECRKLRHAGVDPVAHRKAERSAIAAEAAKAMTFDECATAYMAAHDAGWKNSKHRQQWKNTLATYASPIIGKLPVGSVDTAMVLKIVQPLWTTKPETASRLRGRIETVLDWATVGEMRTGDNPARWSGHLEHLLPALSKVRKVKHHAAMPYGELPAWMAVLRASDALSARATEFAILTGARTGETIGSRANEFDLDKATWTVPAGRMKGDREHRVTLSDRAIAIVRERMEAASKDGTDLLFPLSNMAMLTMLRKRKMPYTVHGFRSTFADWSQECTAYPKPLVDACIAHAGGDKVAAAYFRSDLLAQRRRVMDDWAAFCAGAPLTGNVVPLRSA